MAVEEAWDAFHALQGLGRDCDLADTLLAAVMALHRAVYHAHGIDPDPYTETAQVAV